MSLTYLCIASISNLSEQEEVPVQIRLFDPSMHPANDFCGGSWDVAKPRWWTSIHRFADLNTIVRSCYEKVPAGGIITNIFGAITSPPFVVSNTGDTSE